MNAATTQHEWAKYIRFFGEQNAGRPTRLGVFERNGDVVTDYWLENGLPLTSIDIDTKKELPWVQITVGTFTHEARNAVKLEFQFSLSGDEDGINITDADGRSTVLRFESRPVGN